LIITQKGYSLKFIQKVKIKNGDGHLSTLIFTFHSSKNKIKYVLNIEEYEEQLFAIKFYPKSLKKSDLKYNIIINKGDVIKVLMTCASVIPHILESNENASFGFVGSRTFDSSRRAFTENSILNKRYRVYSKLIKEVIGNKTFVHMEYEKISGYLLINKSFEKIEIKEAKIKEVLNGIYTFVEELQ